MKKFTAGVFACAAVAVLFAATSEQGAARFGGGFRGGGGFGGGGFGGFRGGGFGGGGCTDLAAEDLSGSRFGDGGLFDRGGDSGFGGGGFGSIRNAGKFADRSTALQSNHPEFDARQLQQNRFNEANTLQQNRFSEANNLQYNHENNWTTGAGIGAAIMRGWLRRGLRDWCDLCAATGRRRRDFCRQRAILVRQRRLLRDAEWAIRYRAATAWSHCRNTSVLVLDCLCRHQHASRLWWGVL